MPIISIIVAVDEQNAIGRNNGLLCHLPADLKYFKSITDGHSIVMGRKTFESLPKGALPNRRNIVVTRNSSLQWSNVETCGSLSESFDLTKDEEEVFIIGGGAIYKAAFEFCNRLYVTKIKHRFDDADTFFPAIDPTLWKLSFQEDHLADEKNKYDFSFLIFTKR